MNQRKWTWNAKSKSWYLGKNKFKEIKYFAAETPQLLKYKDKAGKCYDCNGVMINIKSGKANLFIGKFDGKGSLTTPCIRINNNKINFR